MSDLSELDLTVDDHNKAFTEVSFLLSMFAETIVDLMGGGTNTVGRIAGRNMAKKLPIWIPEPTIEAILTELADHMGAGFDIEFQCDDSGADVTYGRCAIRDTCEMRGIEPGGELCKMFHFAIGGIANKILERPARARIVSAGKESCTTRLDVR